MVSLGSSTYSKRLLHLISWGHWFTFFNIIVAIILSSTYLIAEPLPETLLGKIYLLLTWVSHMGFVTFIGFVLIVFPITLIYPKTRFIRASSSFLFAAGLVLLLLDAFVYNKLGYHLNASSSEQIISLINNLISQNARLFWFVALVITILIISFELVVSNYAWKHLRDLQKMVFARYTVFALVVAFFFSHITHIWADANLEYDILRQDTVLPLSYPATAKTLLTKYDLFDKEDYIERKTSPLTFTKSIPAYPQLAQQCQQETPNRSTYIVVTENLLSNAQHRQFSHRAGDNKIELNRHIDNALPNDAWFNLLYGLPSIYKNQIVSNNVVPLLIQASNQSSLSNSFTLIHDNNVSKELPIWLTKLFSELNSTTNISPLLVNKSFMTDTPSLKVFYFTQQDSYQFELFIDALLLAQKSKATKDIIWISSIGNKGNTSRFAIKPALLIHPELDKRKVNKLTSHMDVATTLLTHWLGCNNQTATPNGEDFVSLSQDRIIANTVDDGVIVFNKDKSVFIDQNSNFQSYSRQLKSPITVKPDYPLLIDGVNFIKRFSTQAKKQLN